LIDESGNVINKKGIVVYKQFELDKDDEIPAPFDQKPVVVLGKAAVEQEVMLTITPEPSIHEVVEQSEQSADEKSPQEEIA
jgi:hypothetical protein